MKDSPEQKEALRFSTNEMKTKLGENSVLAKHLIPDFAVGCRRPTPGNGYLEALGQSNVRVVTDEIAEVVEVGIKLITGEILEVDALVCATGFDVSFCPRFPVIGDKVSLAEQWKEKPSAYLSIGAENMPNYLSGSLSSSCLSSCVVLLHQSEVKRLIWGSKQPTWDPMHPSATGPCFLSLSIQPSISFGFFTRSRWKTSNRSGLRARRFVTI